MKQLPILVLLTFLVGTFANGQITPEQMVANMGRGINIGNVLSAPIEGNWATALEETYIQDVASVGFSTVRIPIDFFGDRTTGDTSSYSKEAGTAGSYTGSPSDYIVSSTYLDRVEEVINWALNNNLVVILDFHGNTLKHEFLYTYSPKPDLTAYYTNPSSAKRAADNEKFRAIWTQIADRFKGYSYNLLFEVINEPYFYLTDVEMDNINTDVISIIRATGSNNADRNIIITGGSENSYEAPLQIGDAILGLDDNLIATFHYYWPRAFTASGTEAHNDYDWGTLADKIEIDTNFGAVQSWSITNNIPVFLGEFGADNEGGYDYSTNTYGNFGGPENASRVEYHRYLAEKALELGFAFTAWDAGHKSNKTIYIENTRSWVVDVRNALLGSLCATSGIIKNADIECGYNVDWDLFTQSGANALSSDAVASNVRTGSKAIEVDVTIAGSNFNNVILRNQELINSDFAGKLLTFKVYAKGLNGGEEFKMRVKSIDGTTTSYPSSEKFTLTTNYQPYSFQYQVPSNNVGLQFQVILGKSQGTHFFDDFLVTEETLQIEDIELSKNAIKVYPNPAKDIIAIKSNFEILNLELYDVFGRKYILNPSNTNQYQLPTLASGTYILRIYCDDNSLKTQKLLIN